MKKFFNKEQLDTVLDARDRRLIELTLKPIEVQFCRDCPLFEHYYWQSDSDVEVGWCRGRSYYRTFDDESPYYVYVNSNSFCDPKTILDREVGEIGLLQD